MIPAAAAPYRPAVRRCGCGAFGHYGLTGALGPINRDGSRGEAWFCRAHRPVDYFGVEGEKIAPGTAATAGASSAPATATAGVSSAAAPSTAGAPSAPASSATAPSGTTRPQRQGTLL